MEHLQFEDSLERQSFTNMVFFYFDELSQIIGGIRALLVFPQKATRTTIRNRGLIQTKYTIRGSSNTIVTDDACEILGEWTNLFGEED